MCWTDLRLILNKNVTTQNVMGNRIWNPSEGYNTWKAVWGRRGATKTPGKLDTWESVAVFVPACLNFLFLGFLVYFSSSGLVFLNFTLQWFSLQATKAETRILQWTIKKTFLKCWKPYAYRSSLSQVTGRWKPYNMFCIFNYVIIAEMGLLVKQISQQQIQGATVSLLFILKS